MQTTGSYCCLNIERLLRRHETSSLVHVSMWQMQTNEGNLIIQCSSWLVCRKDCTVWIGRRMTLSLPSFLTSQQSTAELSLSSCLLWDRSCQVSAMGSGDVAAHLLLTLHASQANDERQMLNKARVPFPSLPLLLLPQTMGALPKHAETLSEERKIRKGNPDGFRQSTMRKSCLHDEAGI